MAAPSAPGERETAAEAATAPNVAAVRETAAVPAAAPGAAVAPESAAASVPTRSELAEMASRKETAVKTAAQPAAVCPVCSGSGELSQSALPPRTFLFTPSTPKLPLPDDSSSGSEADEVLAPGRQAAVAARRRKRLRRSRPWTFPDCTVTSCVPRIEQQTHEDNGSGSTGLPQAFWTADISDQRPQMTCTLILPNARPSWTQL
ncbi:testis-specific gene A8 protein-like [Corvus kubaryi]|uniref:testis-specific gene A8 protein-like n=1 Tax=Corvus kubaryi TaxID=68294 RepID=UPI001C04E6F3|nr:testis-specific gene A8 protein-like [Corvus kubaryi]